MALGSLASSAPSRAPVSKVWFRITTCNLVLDLFAAVRGRDLGSVASDVQRIVSKAHDQLPAGSDIVVRGQVQTMHASFAGLLAGLAAAIVLVYLLMVVNFQSWLDPLAIVGALPVALSGMHGCCSRPIPHQCSRDHGGDHLRWHRDG